LAFWFKVLRSYTGSDPIGLELAGALKNVYAIATGLADGLGFENNTRAGEFVTFFEAESEAYL
jgi:glycerol-3-phosphate dehydrogenase